MKIFIFLIFNIYINKSNKACNKDLMWLFYLKGSLKPNYN